MLTSNKSVDELRDELLQIDDDLRRLGEQEREAERGIDSLALLAHRGDMQAEKKIGTYEESRATALSHRKRLQAARASVESELQMVQSVANRETLKEKAREAKKIVERLRNRGPNIGQALRTALQEYAALQEDMASLAGLGMTRITGELVRANCRRTMRAALMPIRTDLEMPIVPPLERRTFSELVGAWSGTAERWIESVLNQPEAVTSQVEPLAAEQAPGAGEANIVFQTPQHGGV